MAANADVSPRRLAGAAPCSARALARHWPNLWRRLAACGEGAEVKVILETPPAGRTAVNTTLFMSGTRRLVAGAALAVRHVGRRGLG